MTLVDGKKIAQEIANVVTKDVSTLGFKPTMMVFACEPNFETQKYLALKKAKAEALGIGLEVVLLPKQSTTAEVVSVIKGAVPKTNGIVVQLPLPVQIDTEAVLAAVPASHDVDAFNYRYGKSSVLPPVVGAIAEISKVHQLDWKNKQVVIFGSGRLVGTPALIYAKKLGAIVTVISEKTKDVSQLTQAADIIILGVGKANLLTFDMVKDGVAVFDAGASEDGGLLVGDASRDVAEKASLFTPVPGGIGPITIALLFRNLIELVRQ